MPIRSLIAKDIRFNRRVLLFSAFFVTAYAAYMARSISRPGVWFVFMALLATFMPLGLWAREDKFRGHALTCSLPLRRDQVVQARYLGATACSLAMYAAGLAASLAMPGSIFAKAPVSWAAALIQALFLICLLQSLLLPLQLRFGYLAIIYLLVGLQVLGIVALFLASRGGSARLALGAAIRAVAGWARSLQRQWGEAGYLAFLVLLSLALLALCYLAAAALFRRREF